MTDTDGYNGWKNYETWLISLWVDNDEATYLGAREWGADETDPRELGRMLRGYVEQLPEASQVIDGPASFVLDLLLHGLGRVDWDEIAEAHLSERDEIDA